MAVKRAAKTALVVNTSLAEIKGPSDDVFAVNLDEEADGNSGAKVKLRRKFARVRDENSFKEVPVHSVLVE